MYTEKLKDFWLAFITTILNTRTELKQYLKKKQKKRRKIKKEKHDPSYEENINPETFMDEDGFGWKKKDAKEKLFKPKKLKKTTDAMDTDEADIAETEEEKKERLAREGRFLIYFCYIIPLIVCIFNILVKIYWSTNFNER